MQPDSRQLLRTFRPSRILLPVILGLGAATYLLVRSFDAEAFSHITWSWNSSFWIFMALIMMVIRDWAYMVRIRALTDYELNWKSAFYVIMLWEFSSALAPGMIGGGFFFAIFILNREKINMGKSITAIMLSSFQDGIFLALMAPLVYFTIGRERLFSTMDLNNMNPVKFGEGFFYTFWANRDGYDPERAWKSYHVQVVNANRMYGCRNLRGYESDQGITFLKYGLPSTVVDGSRDNKQLPYLIWHYYRAGRYSDKRFVFWEQNTGIGCWELLHSEIPGERHNPQWQAMLSAPLGNASMTDGTRVLSTEGQRVEDNFLRPH